MGKNKNRNQSNRTPPVQPSKPVTPINQPKGPVEQLLELAATNGVSLETDAHLVAGNVTSDRLRDLTAQAQSFSDQLKQKLEIQETKLKSIEAREQKLREENDALIERRRRVEEETGQNRADRAKLESDAKKITHDAVAFVKRENELLEREKAADAGFIALRNERLAPLTAQLEVAQANLEQVQSQILEAPLAWNHEKIRLHADWQTEVLARSQSLDEAHQRKWDAHIAQQGAAREQLADAQNQLQRTRIELDRKARELEWQEAELKSERQQLSERADQIAARKIERSTQIISSLEERLEDSRERNAALEREKTELGQQVTNAGGSSAAELHRKNCRLEDEKLYLTGLIATLPSSEDGVRLRALEETEEKNRKELEQLRLERSELQSRSDRQGIAVSELQSLREQQASLERIKQVLEQDRNTLRDQLGELTERAEAKEVFPACRRIASEPPPNHVKAGTTVHLEQFVERVRSQIAHRPKPLYYSPQIIRSFVAGLATSRLHVLQGISGTGKTSLPQVFAEMIGGKAETIAVQAGWRDRQDLIGYFSTFEKKFYESAFLRAIYQSGTEGYRDRPYLIILDEMNLSHPEQYFADVLSGLEGQEGNFALELTPSKINQQELPPLIKVSKSDSVVLPIPGNVWFIGTANEDETTQKFAEKTFDRAHIMELTRHTREKIASCDPLEPVSYRALRAAFESAKQQHEPKLQPCFDFLTTLEAPLRGFGIGWGSRLENQIRDYVPVYIATGGAIGEALDDVIATKILRKIRGRFGNTAEDLQGLIAIFKQWKLNETPVQSLNILEQELEKIDAGYR